MIGRSGWLWCIGSVVMFVVSCAQVRPVRNTDGGQGDSTLGGSWMCVSESISATRAPMDLLLVVDASTSMDTVVEDRRTKWDFVREALTNFINLPGSTGLSVGLTFFPVPGADCSPGNYKQLRVPFGQLPGHASALHNAIGTTRPSASKPTGPACEGGIAAVRASVEANPGRKGALVLITDGVPDTCRPTDAEGLARIAAFGFTGTPSVTTHAIGLFAKETQVTGKATLRAITAMGGSGEPFILDQAQDLRQNLLDTLAAVGGVALPCSFPMPQPSVPLDYTKVSVRFAGAGDWEVPYVGGSARCHASQGGWYYDDRLPPTRVNLCPESCQRLTAEPGTKVDLRSGCNPKAVQ